MFDLDLDLDFALDLEEHEDIEQVATKEKRIYFDLDESFARLRQKLRLPEKGESIRTISPQGGWSSCSLLMWLADREQIEELTITTLRVGKKEMAALGDMIERGRIGRCKIVLCDISRENTSKGGKRYDYQEAFETSCAEYGVDFVYKRNHAKVILAKTKENYYVCETSSNFNENPKIEQFILSNSEEIYKFYKTQFEKLGL